MAPRKTKPKLTVVEPPQPPAQDEKPAILADLPIPDHIEPPWDQLYRDLVHEVISLRSVATATDLSMIGTALAHAMTEDQARDMAQRAYDAADYDSYLKMVKLMQAASRGKSGILGSLGLTGDRRGSTNANRRNLGATNPTAVTSTGKKGSAWQGLL